MFGFRAFLFGLTAGTGLGYFAMNYHVVYGPEGPVVVSRIQQPPIRSSYVDVRNWSAAMWQRYPDVTAALVKAGKGDMIARGVAQNIATPESANPAPGWGEQASGLKAQAQQGLNSLMESIPPIKFEEDVEPTPATTIPSQTRRTDDDALEFRPTSGPSAAKKPPVQLGQATDAADKVETQMTTAKPAIDLGQVPLSSTIPPEERLREIASKAGVSYEQVKTILGEPAPFPGQAPQSTIPATSQQRTVPQPPVTTVPQNGSAVDALKTLFGGPGTSQQGAAPRTNREIKTPAF